MSVNTKSPGDSATIEEAGGWEVGRLESEEVERWASWEVRGLGGREVGR